MKSRDEHFDVRIGALNRQLAALNDEFAVFNFKLPSVLLAACRESPPEVRARALEDLRHIEQWGVDI